MMELLEGSVSTLEGLLGHGDAPSRVTLPMAAWAAAVAGDGLAMATGSRALDGLAAYAIGAGLLGTAAAAVTGIVEGRSGEVRTESHEGPVAAHAAGALAVAGLFAASLAVRLRDDARGTRPSALARGLALGGAGLALANAILTRRLVDRARAHDEAHGRARLDPDSPLGLHRARG